MAATRQILPDAIIDFWFNELEPKDWFVKNDALDQQIITRFGPIHLALAAQVPEAWRATAETVLALIIVYDQFPRNIYRGTPLAFATDGLALNKARAAVDAGLDQQVGEVWRTFFYMPFEHAEVLSEQDRSVDLFARLGNEQTLDYAHQHRNVIARFGRFPHRNAILGRASTADEIAYLSEPGAGF